MFHHPARGEPKNQDHAHCNAGVLALHLCLHSASAERLLLPAAGTRCAVGQLPLPLVILEQRHKRLRNQMVCSSNHTSHITAAAALAAAGSTQLPGQHHHVTY